MVTNVELATRVDELLTRVDQLLLGRVLTATLEYRTETADADPGDGRFRLNNATLSSVTEGYFDDQDTEGSSISALIDTYDDSSSAIKGTLVLASLDDAANWAAYRIVGTVEIPFGYRRLTLEHIVSAGTWTAGERFAQAFYRSGDVGQATNIEIGTVGEGEAYAEITGTAPNLTLHLNIPKGNDGDPGPANSLVIGTVTEGPAAASIIGDAPTQTLNLVLPKGDPGDTGPRGYSVLSGAGAPGSGVGENGDYYIDIASSDRTFYGPKAFGEWPAGVSLRGPSGDTGDPGADANTILSGTGSPGGGTGANGDFYIDLATLQFYGPKVGGVWGAGTSLIGPTGPGSGDVVGPSLATSDMLVAFNGTTGKLVKSAGTSAAQISANLDARTGASPVRTADFNFTSLGPREIVDTTAGAITGTLPASPATGARVMFSDGADFSVNALTIARNGQLIEGLAENCTVDTAGTSGGFVFMGGSIGWRAFKA